MAQMDAYQSSLVSDFSLYDERQILYNLVVSLYNRPENHSSPQKLRKVPTAHCILEYGLCPRLLWVMYTIMLFVPIVNVMVLMLFGVWVYYLFQEYSVIMRNNRVVKDAFQYMVCDPTLDSFYTFSNVPTSTFLSFFPDRSPHTPDKPEQLVTFFRPELRTHFEQIILIGFCTYLYVLAMVTMGCVSLGVDVLWYVATTHDW